MEEILKVRAKSPKHALYVPRVTRRQALIVFTTEIVRQSPFKGYPSIDTLPVYFLKLFLQAQHICNHVNCKPHRPCFSIPILSVINVYDDSYS